MIQHRRPAPMGTSPTGPPGTPATKALAEARWLAVLVFAQMLPATLVTPAIRPLFAEVHGANESAMHAFMSVNMLGALLAAPWLGRLADRAARPGLLLAGLAAADAMLLVLIASPLPTSAVLGLRFTEGAAHVGAATLLLAEAAALRTALGDGRAMGMAGAAIMFAIASGSAIGGIAVSWGSRAPFWLAAGLAATVMVVAVASLDARPRGRKRRPSHAGEPLLRTLAPILTAAFVERFAVGCVIVTFALFAHRAHGLSDAAIGFHFALLTLPFALLTYPASRLGDRVPRAGVMTAGALLYGASLGALGHLPRAVLPWTMVAAGCGAALIFAPTLCYAARLAGPARRGRAMALLNASGCLGMLVGPAVAGAISALGADSTDPVQGYRSTFVIAGGAVLSWLAFASGWLAGRLREEAGAIASREDALAATHTSEAALDSVA